MNSPNDLFQRMSSSPQANSSTLSKNKASAQSHPQEALDKNVAKCANSSTVNSDDLNSRSDAGVVSSSDDEDILPPPVVKRIDRSSLQRENDQCNNEVRSEKTGGSDDSHRTVVLTCHAAPVSTTSYVVSQSVLTTVSSTCAGPGTQVQSDCDNVILATSLRTCVTSNRQALAGPIATSQSDTKESFKPRSHIPVSEDPHTCKIVTSNNTNDDSSSITLSQSKLGESGRTENIPHTSSRVQVPSRLSATPTTPAAAASHTDLQQQEVDVAVSIPRTSSPLNPPSSSVDNKVTSQDEASVTRLSSDSCDAGVKDVVTAVPPSSSPKCGSAGDHGTTADVQEVSMEPTQMLWEQIPYDPKQSADQEVTSQGGHSSSVVGKRLLCQVST